MNRQQINQQQELSHDEHVKLLEAIGNLPYDHIQMRIYQKSIEELFTKYESQVRELTQTLTDYGEVATAIEKMQSLMSQRKYIQVRRKAVA